ncbi:HPr kinase/phosphorylase [Actibacterium sp. 188UL27-1]|uniref:HPr kinase/phosphorylase n=1 Tax=Actibacterium sp. 188UL27-1 TaxID=2786961 RepID=UPI00210291B8|nr:HPr kinase/phosphatase C-terminal domain-containing protein [Actibacterium sp. 188UL27-1]
MHASTVAVAGKGLLILGASGAGKSALAIEMLALGAALVADDRTIVERCDTTLMARAPGPIRNLLEMRGIGLLTVPSMDQVVVHRAIDLDQIEVARLPQTYAIELLGVQLPLFRRPEGSHLASALMLCMQHGLCDGSTRDHNPSD